MQIVKYMRSCFMDVRDSLARHEVWSLLAWSEIRQRYRRSTLGPFWLTISMGVTVAGMGPLYGKLFNHDLATYLAFLAIGMVIWGLISGLITESCAGFIQSEGFIKEFNLPIPVYIFRVVWRNLIIFAHNAIIVVLVLLVYRPPVNWSLLLLPVAIFAIAFNGLWLGLLLAVFCTRFRDIHLVIGSVLQIGFFLTPILWPASMLGNKAWLLNFNPIYFFVEAVRGPLLGASFNAEVWIGLGVTSVLVMVISAVAYGRFRYRIAYWV